jgi:hypothetical protein
MTVARLCWGDHHAGAIYDCRWRIYFVGKQFWGGLLRSVLGVRALFFVSNGCSEPYSTGFVPNRELLLLVPNPGIM